MKLESIPLIAVDQYNPIPQNMKKIYLEIDKIIYDKIGEKYTAFLKYSYMKDLPEGGMISTRIIPKSYKPTVFTVAEATGLQQMAPNGLSGTTFTEQFNSLIFLCLMHKLSTTVEPPFGLTINDWMVVSPA